MSHLTLRARTGARRATLVAAILSLGACARPDHGVVTVVTPTPPPGAVTAPKTGASALADSVRHSHTQADVDFMTGMISHHAQAIKMSGWAEGHGASADIQRLAGRIINAQTDEIRLMQTWLRDQGLPAPEPDPDGMTMTMNGMSHTMLMPGMLSPAQMDTLDAARGKQFDRLFLTYMIQHHQGALTMVDQLFGTPGAAQNDITFKLASDVQADQSTEVARMQLMLQALPLPGAGGQ